MTKFITEIAQKYPAIGRGIEIAFLTFAGLAPTYILAVFTGNLELGIGSLITNVLTPVYAAWSKYTRDNEKALLEDSMRAANDLLDKKQ